jgi:hypothetical protein
MIRKPAVTGATVEERREAREERRRVNRRNFVTKRANGARNGRERLVAACNAALAIGRRLTDDGRRALAHEIIQVVERADAPANRKAQS